MRCCYLLIRVYSDVAHDENTTRNTKLYDHVLTFEINYKYIKIKMKDEQNNCKVTN